MSITLVYSRILVGLSSPLITIEAHISNGLPSFTLVGLAETSIKESKDRVRCAIINTGYLFPTKRITLNLAPADQPKEGTGFDLPLALAILSASKQIETTQLENYIFIGELSLSGEIKRVRGAITIALATLKSDKKLIISAENREEMGFIGQKQNIYIASHLNDVISHLNGTKTLSHPSIIEIYQTSKVFNIDFDEITGQINAKRALEIAACGEHNILLMGPPGTGKTLLAERFSTILPELNDEEALECLAINGLNKNIKDITDNWSCKPFRSPHHSITLAGLIGGGREPTAGEITLAHNGVLFLDELTEFKKPILDALRQPLEKGEITLSRANKKITFPASFQLITAMNPSPTGHYQGNHNRATPQQLLNYINRLSAPFLERFDLSIEVNLEHGQETSLSTTAQPENSAIIRERVIKARAIQLKRQTKSNARLTIKEISKYAKLTNEDQLFIDATIKKLHLSPRRKHRIIKLARTIADLDNQSQIMRTHLIEALSYRCIDNFILNLIKSCSS